MARSDSLKDFMDMTEVQARAIFNAVRWKAWQGAPICPKCAGREMYILKNRNAWRCKAKSCSGKVQFSVTSGTVLAGHKTSLKSILLTVAFFAKNPKGTAALQLCRDLDIQYKTAWVIEQKLREGIWRSQQSIVLDGIVEIDGGTFGGSRRHYNKPLPGGTIRRSRENLKNRRVVVVIRERLGRTVTVVVRKESEAIGRILQHVRPTAILQADQARGWDALQELFTMLRVNHKFAFSHNNACTNWAESYFARLRRAHIGTHHAISAKYLYLYAAEMAWREDFRHETLTQQVERLLEMLLTPSIDSRFKGYWQSKEAAPDNVVPFPSSALANQAPNDTVVAA